MNPATVAALLEKLTEHYNVAQEYFAASPYNLAVTGVLGFATVVFFTLWRCARVTAPAIVENKPLELAYSELMVVHRDAVNNMVPMQQSYVNGINKLTSDHSVTLRSTIEQLTKNDE